MRLTHLSVAVLLSVVAIPAAPVDLMIGARGYGMGGAYSAIVDDPSAAYWNPGALGYVSDPSIMESNWILQDVSHINVNYCNAAIPIPKVGTVSGGWLLRYALLEEGPDADAERWGEHTFSLAMGRVLWNKLLIFERTALGFSINRHTFSSFDSREENGAGLGFDLGLVTKFPLGFSLAIVGRNLATDIMGERTDPEGRVGLGYTTTLRNMHRITVAVDGLYKPNRDYLDAATLEPARHNVRGFGGIEYAILFHGWEVAVRGGGNALAFNSLETYGYTAGIGARYLGYSVQYAFIGSTDPDAALGFGHRVDLIVQLNKLLGPAKNRQEK